MSVGSEVAKGRYTTFFTSISAADVQVAGLAPGSAGSQGTPRLGLSSYPAWFSLSPDTSFLVRYAAASAPARAAIFRDEVLPELLAAD